jgi:1-acyl-sn-glycerol-3-phosphate acyltransferase
LAQLQNTVFIDRKRRNAAEHLDAVQKHLRKGGNIVIFPEGTSGDGSRVMPFKHTLFRVVDSGSESNPVVIQPVVIAYTHVNGLPVGRYERPYFCWYGDMDMIPHLWNVLKLGSFKVDITFLPPIQKNQFEDHKALSHYCQTLVSNTFSAKIRGRDAVHPMALAATSA